MKIDQLDTQEIRLCFNGAKTSLEKNCDVLDDLNVYPVPDGDTGVNMLFTIKPAVEELNNLQGGNMRDIFEHIGRTMTNNSRGNSGFILSRFFFGFSEILQTKDVIHASDFTEAFARGRYQVLASLMNPVQGTMVTIIDRMLETLEEHPENSDIISQLDAALKEARVALFETPQMLPVLARAGVVDSGALGFICLMEGFRNGLLKEPINHEHEQDYRFPPDENVKDDVQTQVQNRYCTEVLVNKLSSTPGDELKEYLKSQGDSIALVSEEDLIKVHIHTNDPEDVIKYLGSYGTVFKQKVEDMQDQVSRVLDKLEDNEKLAVLAIIPGPGFEEILRGFDVEEFVVFAEKLPTAGEVSEALKRIDSDSILILPNDKNIIPVAKIAAEQSDKKVHILPTTSIVQGITAMYGFGDYESAKENITAMGESMEIARAIKLYKSNREARFGTTVIEKGKFFAVEGHDILAIGENQKETILEALKKVDISSMALSSLYYNDEFQQEILESLIEGIKDLNSYLEIENYYTGQKSEILIISLE